LRYQPVGSGRSALFPRTYSGTYDGLPNSASGTALPVCRSIARDDPGRRSCGNDPATAGVISYPLISETMMTKPVPPVPEDNQSHKGPGSAPSVPLDTTKGHRDDEKNNIREQAEHGNMTQNTSNRRSG
jgi:hypothetical protein